MTERTTVALNVLIEPRYLAWLRAEAAKEKRSMRAQLEVILEDAMRQDGGEA